MTELDRLTPIAQSILEALHKYRYLTRKQMHALGIARDSGHLGDIIGRMLSPIKRKDGLGRKPKEIGELDYGVRVTGRYDRVYYLAREGALLLDKLYPEDAPFSYSKRAEQFASQYDHRLRIIDLHIMAEQWAAANNHELTQWLNDFDYVQTRAGERPAACTRVPVGKSVIVPDAVFKLRDPKGIERLFCLEIVNGREKARVLRQLHNYIVALEKGSINKEFDFVKGVRVLFVFDYPELMQGMQQQCRDDPWAQPLMDYFFFQKFSDLSSKTLTENWNRIDSRISPVALFAQ